MNNMINLKWKEKKDYDLRNAKELQQLLHLWILYHKPSKLQQMKDDCHLHFFAFWRRPHCN